MINLRSISYLLFFFSGFSALVYEVVWTRQLSAIFGSTAESVGVVLATFLSSMALGGLVLGRTADRVKNRFLFFAVLEALIGLYGLLASAGFGVFSVASGWAAGGLAVFSATSGGGAGIGGLSFSTVGVVVSGAGVGGTALAVGFLVEGSDTG